MDDYVHSLIPADSACKQTVINLPDVLNHVRLGMLLPRYVHVSTHGDSAHFITDMGRCSVNLPTGQLPNRENREFEAERGLAHRYSAPD